MVRFATTHLPTTSTTQQLLKEIGPVKQTTANHTKSTLHCVIWGQEIT